MSQVITHEQEKAFAVYNNVSIFLTKKGTFQATVDGIVSTSSSLAGMKRLISKLRLPSKTVTLICKRNYGMTGVMITGPGKPNAKKTYDMAGQQFEGVEGRSGESNPANFKFDYRRGYSYLLEGDMNTVVKYKEMIARHQSEMQAIIDTNRLEIDDLMETLAEISDEEILRRLYA